MKFPVRASGDSEPESHQESQPTSLPSAAGRIHLRVSSMTFTASGGRYDSGSEPEKCLALSDACQATWQLDAAASEQWVPESPSGTQSQIIVDSQSLNGCYPPPRATDCDSLRDSRSDCRSDVEIGEKEKLRQPSVIGSFMRPSAWRWVRHLCWKNLRLTGSSDSARDSDPQPAPTNNLNTTGSRGRPAGRSGTSWFQQQYTTRSTAAGRRSSTIVASANATSSGGSSTAGNETSGTSVTKPDGSLTGSAGDSARGGPKRRGWRFQSLGRSCVADYLLVVACLSVLFVSLPYHLMLPLTLTLALPPDRITGDSGGYEAAAAAQAATGSFQPSEHAGPSRDMAGSDLRSASIPEGPAGGAQRQLGGSTGWFDTLPLPLRRLLRLLPPWWQTRSINPADDRPRVGSTSGWRPTSDQPDGHSASQESLRTSQYPPSHLRSLVGSSFFAPHASLPLHRGHSSGICIAITSAPRQVDEGQEEGAWAYASQLLHLLDERRARTPLLERDMWAVVLASGCEVRVAEGVDLSDAMQSEGYVSWLMREAEGRPRWFVEGLVAALQRQQARGRGGLAAKHSDALKNISRGLDLEAYAVPAHAQACALMQDIPLLLRVVEPDMVRVDGWDRWLWRTKLAVDFTYVMHQCLATRPKYVLMLQDDTRPTKLWDVGIERFISRDLWEKPAWTMLSLYHPVSYRWGTGHGQEYKLPCCAQALLFDASKVLPLLSHMEAEFMARPMDLNIRTYLEGSNSHAYVHVPSLFQHTGVVRTNVLRVKYHHDPLYRDDVIANPYEGEVCAKKEPPVKEDSAVVVNRGYPPVELMADPSSITVAAPVHNAA